MGTNISSVGGLQDTHLGVGRRAPDQNGSSIFLAILPFVLILLVDVLPMLLVVSGLLSWEAAAMQAISAGLGILVVGVFLGGLVLGWRRHWPAWSASWLPFFAVVPVVVAFGLLEGLLQDERLKFGLVQPAAMFLIFPALTAALLYAVTRRDRRRGLLAALPVVYFIWLPNMEFVPDSIEMLIKLASTLLICLVVAYLLVQADWRRGLYAVLAGILVVGALFSYGGIYHGGSLPSSAPNGLSLLEVARSLIPQYVAAGAILLGPLFAWKFRQIGRAGGRGGEVAYHLALTGLLLVILTVLASLMVTMDSSDLLQRTLTDPVLGLVVLLGLGAYLLGVFWLYREDPAEKDAAGWVERALLALLPLAMPVAFVLPFITWKVPMSRLYGIPLLWELPHAVSLALMLVWMGLSVWVVVIEPARRDRRIS